MFTKSLATHKVKVGPNWPTTHDQGNQVWNYYYRLLHPVGESRSTPLDFKR